MEERGAIVGEMGVVDVVEVERRGEARDGRRERERDRNRTSSGLTRFAGSSGSTPSFRQAMTTA